MKYRILLTDDNKKKTPLGDEPNGWHLVNVESSRNSEAPYKVTLKSGRVTLFRPNKCYWDEIDIDEGSITAIEHNIELIPLPVLKRKSYV
jgi:hypothetical protein